MEVVKVVIDDDVGKFKTLEDALYKMGLRLIKTISVKEVEARNKWGMSYLLRRIKSSREDTTIVTEGYSPK